MGKSSFVELTIREFKQYIKRRDIRTPNWFSIQHNILLHPDFFDVDGDEFKAFIWVLGVACHINCDKIRVYPDVCASQIKIPIDKVFSCIEKLKRKRWDVTRPSRVRSGNSKVTYPTGQDKTEQNRTGIIQGLSTQAEHSSFLTSWNETVKALPKIRDWTERRKKAEKVILKRWSLDDWKKGCQKVEESDFLSGRSGKWTSCSFDWVINPTNFTKIIEGTYDNRSSKAGADLSDIPWAPEAR